MHEAVSTAAHVTHFDEADVTEFVKIGESLKGQAAEKGMYAYGHGKKVGSQYREKELEDRKGRMMALGLASYHNRRGAAIPL
jgi:hypothetical protein